MELYGQELTTIPGTRTYDVQQVDEQGNEKMIKMTEPFFVKGICKTASLISFTDELPSGSSGMPSSEPSFDVLSSKTAYGYGVAVGAEVFWELVAYRSTPYGEGYKTEANFRSMPNDLFKSQ